MTDCIKLKLTRIDERNDQLTKEEYLHTTATTSPTATISTTADASWRKRQS